MKYPQNISRLINKTWFSHGSLLHILIIHFRHLIYNYVINLNITQVIMTPKSHILNITFRQSNLVRHCHNEIRDT